ncbi:RAD50-interacting protein 1 [Neodiprion lecontei]|uniref:RAD50-interacting protein 1 n=1 Tax=Neodiprion lecontei TaxID=441921 RepID=A0A6J0BEF2_NEOLC|nr:RAD50-interacting protein 1 [Neodiprion lecontei]XP_015512772.2 RAD50-interacting protein 1 [Neodiprion lecontei]
MDPIKVKVIQEFNAELGSDLKNLGKIPQLHERLQHERNNIEKSLSLASTEAPSKVKAAIEGVDKINNEIEELVKISNDLEQVLIEQLQQDSKIDGIRENVDKIEELQRALSYLYLVKSIEDICDEIEGSLLAKDDKLTITLYANLTERNSQLQSSTCHHLVTYLHDTLHFWHNYLKDKFTAEYNEILKALKWPFCGSNLNLSTTPSLDAMARFSTVTEYLLQLQLPEETAKPAVTSSLLTDFIPVSLPILLLIRPLRRRFIYHFTGAKQTNRLDKPEWFFTQILTWIRDHTEWVRMNVQPIANSLGLDHINAKVEFMRGLVQLAVEKLYSELPNMQYDDALFAHLIDEALGFERELRDTLLYPASQPATVFVLTQAQIFVKWVNMEKKYATEKMDAILSSETAWERLMGTDIDDMKVTECAEAFLTLLMTITDRYSHLPQPGHRLQFLELQLELVDDWRVRLLQLLHEDYEDPLTSIMPRILNTLHYVSSVLKEWGATVHFLQLHYFKKQSDVTELSVEKLAETSENPGDEDDSVFDEALALLQRLERELVNEISNSVALDVKAKSRPYRTDKWFAMQSEKELASLSVTPSGCPMFQELAARLNTLQDILALPLFNKTWKNLAAQLDQYLLEEIAVVNQFNSGGAAQLQYDIVRNLLPLFGLYTNKPEAYFPLIKEATILLNMALGSAMLLLEALEGNEDTAEVLADVGIYKMTEDIAITVLRNRTDISSQ